MRRADADFLRAPDSGEPLLLETHDVGSEITTGVLATASGRSFEIEAGIPDLTFPPTLAEEDDRARSFYDARAEAYDENLHLTFRTHGVDEQLVRRSFVDALQLEPHSCVLDVSCGTGRDSALIAERLGPDGHLCLQDISREMLDRCRDRLAAADVTKTFAVSNALYLPFPDRSFDAVYSFGGLGEFSDIRRGLAEMVRVAKVGARIVVGDESMPPWLRDTDFARILIETNPQFRAPVPLDAVPVAARDVALRWVIGGVFYLLEFTVGEGEPTADFDFEIPGPRGGTYRTRYYGKLEGVTPEAKALAERARERRGVSMHQWLDDVVRRAAERDLEE